MNKNLKGCFKHNSDDWKTPSKMYEWFTKKCGYYDPCPYKCKTFNGLEIRWEGNVFVNPPYSEIDKWVDKAIKEHLRDVTREIILLVPARTDTKWFRKILNHAEEIKFITGRLHFNDERAGAPFPSILISLYYGSETTECYCIERDYYDEI